MNYFTFKLVVFFLIINLQGFAQLTVKDQDATPNTLFQVIDEGNSGSILIPPIIPNHPSEFSQKLYNYGGALYWNGFMLASNRSAAGWEKEATLITTAMGIEKVGIGTGSPGVMLSLGKSFAAKKLAIWDGINDFYGFGAPVGRLAIFTHDSERISIISNGNVGINTTTPSAKLEVNGDVKIGSSGVKFSEIIEVTGITGGTGTYNIYIDYPSGFNSGNTRVLSLEIEDNQNGWASNGLYFNGRTIHCYLWGQIKIGYPDASTFQSKPFRLVLMKID